MPDEAAAPSSEQDPAPPLDGASDRGTRVNTHVSSRRPSTQAITLLDKTVSRQTSSDGLNANDLTPADTHTLRKRWTQQSVRQTLAQRKYNRYQDPSTNTPPEGRGEAAEQSEASEEQGHYARGKAKVKGLLKSGKQFQRAAEEDAVIDILYENQRGWWFFGVPHFSSRSLLNFDPKPWLNQYKKASPVDITNAQVPDPSWEWAWPSWYVDMSRDVDDEGWEYSFMFNGGTSWHGNHPLGHSWVRRRRWLRKRARKSSSSSRYGTDGKAVDQRRMSDAHLLNAEYFTIHPKRQKSPASSLPPSIRARVQREELGDEPEDVKDIGTLLVRLRRAAVDREKLVLVRHFVENGGEDVYYLADQMHKIMSMCVFQNSRRQLLSMLMEKCDAASQHRAEHDQNQKAEGVTEKRQLDNLIRAIDAADEQVRKLEYWSDVRKMVREGKGHATDDERGWGHKWQGVDASGPQAESSSDAYYAND